MIHILIMAGGEGVRFKPLSTPQRPKQFINIIGAKSLIRQTFERVSSFGEGNKFDNFFVGTNARYIDLVRKEIPEIPLENIIGETAKKNTAPCIGFAAHLISMKDPDAVMICLPSDHVIFNQELFLSTLRTAINVAIRDKKLVTLGITPNSASTEYGYIEKGTTEYSVKRFVEKPDEARATQYAASGNYFWNSGMFVWQARTILDEMAQHVPELYNEISRLGRNVGMPEMINFFQNVPSISIDYGVMERSANVPCRGRRARSP